MLINIVWIDPGGETGVAHALYRPNRTTAPHLQVVRAFQQRRGRAFQVGGDYREQVLTIREFLLETMLKAGHTKQTAYKVRTILGIEGFVFHPKASLAGDALSPVKIAAMLEFYLWLEPETDGIVEVRTQMPSEMSVIKDDTLRRWGLWQPGKKNDDAMPALKHLIVCARKLQNEGL